MSSFKYRTIGYSPEYAVTTPSTVNEFHNANYLKSTSTVIAELNSSILIKSGATLRTTDAPTNILDVVNKTYADNKISKAGISDPIGASAGTMTGLLLLSGDPSAALGAATKQYVDLRIHKDGSVQMTGDLLLKAGTDPTNNDHAARKAYVDQRVLRAGDTMTGYLSLYAHPTSSMHAATRAYVDAKLGSFDAGDGLYVVPVAVNKSGTFTQNVSSSTVTLTITNHGFSFDTIVDIDFTTTAVATISSASWATNTLTFNTALAHNLLTGDVVVISGVTPSGYNGTFTITKTSATQFTASQTSNPGTYTSGGSVKHEPIDGTYSIVSVVGPNQFTVTAQNAPFTAISGTVNVTLNTNQVSVASTTLAITPDAVDLTSINTNSLFLGGSSYSSSTWYDQCKIDQYGRVVNARTTPALATVDGVYNNVKIQGGYITQALNVGYLTENQTISLTGDVVGSGKTGIATELSTITGLSAGTYTKVTVNTKGRVTSATQLSASDISNALGFLPQQESGVQYLHLGAQLTASSWGTTPVSLTTKSGSITGASISGNHLFIPRGIYHVTFYGTNNWWYNYYSYWWYYWSWWENYWTYYYQPAIVYLNGTVQTAAFSNYGGWWWYWNNRYYHPSNSQDFCITDSYNVTSDGSYFQFGLPMLAGCTYWYNVKIVKLK